MSLQQQQCPEANISSRYWERAECETLQELRTDKSICKQKCGECVARKKKGNLGQKVGCKKSWQGEKPGDELRQH